MHFALIRFSSLGDIVLQTPIIAWIKMKFPEAKISFITSKAFKDLISENPFIDEVILIDRLSGKEDRNQLKKIAKELNKKSPAPIVIDLHNTLRSKFLRFHLNKCLCFVVDKRSFLRKLLVWFKLDLLKKLSSHHFRVLEDIAFLFDRRFDPDELRDFLDKNTICGNERLTQTVASFSSEKSSIEGAYLVVSPIASFENKRWPLKNYQNLIKRFLADTQFQNFKIVLVAGPDDEYCEQAIDGEILAHQRFVNLQGKTTIKESAEIIGKSKFCISNDTGTIHMAEACGVPVITLFGPTSESFGFRPHLSKSIALSSQRSCRPCSETGAKKCRYQSNLCMEDISIDEVWDACLELKEVVEKK